MKWAKYLIVGVPFLCGMVRVHHDGESTSQIIDQGSRNMGHCGPMWLWTELRIIMVEYVEAVIADLTRQS